MYNNKKAVLQTYTVQQDFRAAISGNWSEQAPVISPNSRISRLPAAHLRTALRTHNLDPKLRLAALAGAERRAPQCSGAASLDLGIL